jgi:branched-chain amino acid transport system ATP-binding protein
MALLELRDVHTYYGNIHALKGISLTVEQGEIVTLIGSNGAGKSTTLKTIRACSARARARSGSTASGSTGRLPTSRGLGHLAVARGAPDLPAMTVRENLEMGAFQREKGRERDADFERSYALPAAEGAAQPEGRHAVRRRAADARHRPSAHGAPKVLLLDEPSMGLAPILVEQIFEIVKDINAGDDGAPRRAERAHGPGHRQARLHPADGEIVLRTWPTG